MRCAHCDAITETRPCDRCGEDPWIAGRYELEAPLGRGANGTTWLAMDRQGEEHVAIKEIPLRAGDDDPVAILELRGAQVLRQLRHPGVPRWRETEVIGHGKSRSLYVVQDFVDGENLEVGLVGRRYSAVDGLSLADEVLEILVYLHGLSPPVVHRDIKPANLIRRRDGRLALIDFGSVRDALRDAQLGGQTVTGTFGYMAPEQFAGDASPATDLYGLGATLVHLLSRIPPSRLQGPGGHLDWEASVSLPEPARAFLRALLQADPRRRPASAVEARRLCRRALAGLGVPELSLDPPAFAPESVEEGASALPRGPSLAEPGSPPELVLPTEPNHLPARQHAGSSAHRAKGTDPSPLLARRTTVAAGMVLIAFLGGLVPVMGLIFLLMPPGGRTSDAPQPTPVLQPEPEPPPDAVANEIPAPEDRSKPAPRIRVAPKYPREQKSVDPSGTEEKCSASLTVSSAGKPTLSGSITGCSAPYADAVAEVLPEWSFWPALGPDGAPIEAPYTLKATFRLKTSAVDPTP